MSGMGLSHPHVHCELHLALVLNLGFFFSFLVGLLGTVFFAFFCLYLVLCVIAGEMQLGLNLLFITIHPMK